MSLLNKLKTEVNEKFINAQVTGTRNFAPRPGYFFIKSTSYKPVQPLGDILIAQTNWKDKPNGFFIEDTVFEIALSNLTSAKPEETTDLQPEDLIGRVIYIYNPTFVPKTFNGEQRQVLDCQWYFVDEIPSFLNSQNIMSKLFFDDPAAQTNYYQYLINNELYDVLEALEIEATIAYSGDAPVEDNGDSDDYFDGDFDDNNGDGTDHYTDNQNNPENE